MAQQGQAIPLQNLAPAPAGNQAAAANPAPDVNQQAPVADQVHAVNQAQGANQAQGHQAPDGNQVVAGNQAAAANQAPAANPQAAVVNQSPASSQNQILNAKWNIFGSSHADSWWRRWWPQLGAVLMSIGCLLANVGILYSIDGKPLAIHEIFDISITPNTLISIFSTISSFLMVFAVGDCLGQLKWTYFMQRPHRLKDLQIFDDASRGPVGSVVFLFKLNIKAFIASVGAFITIAALANDPFTQALLQYPSDTVPLTNGSASIPRTMQYLGPAGDTSSTTNSYLSNAFWGGLYNPNTQVNYQCTSGDCTWETFQSLAFCSQCEHIANQLKTNCSENSFGSGLECTWTTPMGSKLPSTAPQTYTQNNGFQVRYGITGRGIPPDNAGNNIGPQGQVVSGDFLQFQQHYDFTLDASNVSGSVPLPKGTSCSLSWCMKTYQPKFKNGKLRDTVIDTAPLHFPKDDSYSIFVPNGGGQARLYPGFVGTPIPDNFDAYGAYQSNQSGVVWVSGASMLGVTGILVNTLSFDDLIPSLGGSDVSGRNNPAGSALDGFNNGNLTENFDKIASAISDAVRQAPGNVHVTGKALGSQTFVHVRWPWLSFAATVVFLTAVFVTFTIIFSLERGESIWKSSSIALLFHGLKGWGEQELDVQSMDEMEKKARGMHAVLDRDDLGRMVFMKSVGS